MSTRDLLRFARPRCVATLVDKYEHILMWLAHRTVSPMIISKNLCNMLEQFARILISLNDICNICNVSY